MSAGEHKKAGYLAVHPFGKVPALVCADSTPVFESGAILGYLADKFGGLDTPEARAKQNSWLVWANATLAPAMFGPTRVQAMPGLLEPLNTLLSKQQWLTGSEFAVADVAVGAYLAYTQLFFPETTYKKYPAVDAYMSRIYSRPHYEATIGSE
jgi:glutathione S-transferase